MMAAAVLLLTVIIFSPLRHNTYVNWDDDQVLIRTPLPLMLQWRSVSWMFTTTYMGHYQPLGWLAFAFQNTVLNLSDTDISRSPTFVHMVSVGLHTLTALVLFGVALRLAAWRESGIDAKNIDPLPVTIAAGAAALIFSLHPMRVEVVAWATAQPYLVTSLLALLSLFFYLGWCKQSGEFRPSLLILSILCFALSLLARSAAVTLPVILIILDALILGRRNKWLEKVPYFVLAVAAGIMTIFARRGEIASGLVPISSISEFLNYLGRAVFFPIAQTMLPRTFSPLYDASTVTAEPEWIGILFLAAAIIFSFLMFGLRRRFRAAAAAWFGYLVLIVPFIGLIGGPRVPADRYGYLSLMPIALFIGGGVYLLITGLRQRYIRPAVGISLICLVVVCLFGLSATSVYQCTVWQDDHMLWSHARTIAPHQSAIPAKLGDAIAKNADLMRAMGDHQSALDEYRSAIASYDDALKLDPTDIITIRHRAIVLNKLGQPAEALAQFQKAIDAGADDADTHYQMANILMRLGRTDAAVSKYEDALRREIRHRRAREALVGLHLEQENYKLTAILLQQAVQMDPEDTGAADALAWLLASSPDDEVRNGAYAVELARAVCELTNYQVPQPIDTLAAALAATGQFDRAATTADLAIQVAQQMGANGALIDGIQSRKAKYEQNRPNREMKRMVNPQVSVDPGAS
jgi:tetratricopeptide (TPR) repeat protein